MTSELRGKLSNLQDSVLGAAQAVDQSLATVNAGLDALAKDKVGKPGMRRACDGQNLGWGFLSLFYVASCS